jgi:hypothetical protein
VPPAQKHFNLVETLTNSGAVKFTSDAGICLMNVPDFRMACAQVSGAEQAPQCRVRRSTTMEGKFYFVFIGSEIFLSLF